jgi:hypothetical protein
MSDKEDFSRVGLLKSKITFDEKKYEYDYGFKSADVNNFQEIHTTAEMVAHLERHKKVQLDAKVMGFAADGSREVRTISRDKFTEHFKSKSNAKFKEFDSFGRDFTNSSHLVGQDFVPLLGGPFYKQNYYYADYIRAHAQAFYSYHHDPAGKAIIDIITNFVMGKGFRVDSPDRKALMLWRAVERANSLQEMMRQFCRELAIYGENMVWKLPKGNGNPQSRITYNLPADEAPPEGLLPRYRLVDPSNIVEIVTYPEDITRKLLYVWLTPTQYQLYTGSGKGADVQPSSKFIYRQIPANEMLHYQINCVSNEKRGRSDFYPVLGYMKRLRDAVNYGMISAQKQSAWAIDTTVDGNAADINLYKQSAEQLGTIPQAGSEFIHSKKVTRTFLSNSLGKSGQHEIFEWCWSMIAAGVGIPVSYFGTHMSGGQTRASALVATEPVAKKFEMRQEVMRDVIRDIWDDVMRYFGIEADCEITFPEIITQDRSAKLKDLALAETQLWFSKKRVAETAAKEFGYTDYEYDEENKEIESDPPPPQPMMSPLGAPPAIPRSTPADGQGANPKPSAVTKDERAQVKTNNGS